MHQNTGMSGAGRVEVVQKGRRHGERATLAHKNGTRATRKRTKAGQPSNERCLLWRATFTEIE